MFTYLTTTSQVLLSAPATAVMVAVPGFTAVSFPVWSTVTTSGLLDVQTTFSLASASPVTVRVLELLAVSSTFVSLSVIADVLTSPAALVSPVVGFTSLALLSVAAFGVTVTSMEAFSLSKVTVMVARPYFRAVTVPARSTETTSLLLDSHVAFAA